MNEPFAKNQACCQKQNAQLPGINIASGPIKLSSMPEEVCCGSPPGPESSCYEKPGYALLDFVEEFIQTPAGPVPCVKTALHLADYAGMVRARLGIKRDRYKIAPGLYCVGAPDTRSPLLVTANYKLTFDCLRRELAFISAWILVLDTRGINVWCAAGKDLFSTEEVVRRVNVAEVKKVISHNRLILPQLAATGVAAHEVKKQSGFKVIYGPVHSKDLAKFLTGDSKSEPAMRKVAFNMIDRLILVPVELASLAKPSLWILLAAFFISGIGDQVFSFSAAWLRGIMLAVAYAAGILAGAIATPILLPWIPGRSFAIKGAISGGLCAAGIVALYRTDLQIIEALALMLCTTAVSSYLAMNFTGSTPFTSPSGVEKEMRKAIPLQAAALIVAMVAWVASAFSG
jgi:hypothetical protein